MTADERRTIEEAARRLMSLIDSDTFRDDAFSSDITGTLRRSGEAHDLRERLARAAGKQQRAVNRLFYDDSGDDDLKDGGLGVPGYGFAAHHERMP